MLRRILATGSSWATIPLRMGLGVIFIAHGAQKVLGSFGGPGLKAFASFPAPFPFMKPAWLWMGAAAISELLGGAMLLLGLFTRIGAFLIACTMLTAIIGVHWPIFFADSKGYEYPLALLAGSLALLVYGGGQASIDRMLASRGGGRRRF
jgi:putative oxidoreductase